MSKPIKSRHGLTRCPACRAHVHAAAHASDTVCPFCGASLVARARRILPTGRGGLLAAALFTISAAGCGGGSTDDGTTVEGGDDGAGGDDAVSDGSDTGSDTDGTDGTDTDGDDGYADTPPEEQPAVALYGVAPSE